MISPLHCLSSHHFSSTKTPPAPRWCTPHDELRRPHRCNEPEGWLGYFAMENTRQNAAFHKKKWLDLHGSSNIFQQKASLNQFITCWRNTWKSDELVVKMVVWCCWSYENMAIKLVTLAKRGPLLQQGNVGTKQWRGDKTNDWHSKSSELQQPRHNIILSLYIYIQIYYI